MGDTLSVTIDTANDTVQPTLEEEAAKYDNLESPSNQDRPEWLPEKFKSPEDMAKAYSELEKKLGSRPVSEEAPVEEAPVENEDGLEDDAPKSAEEQAREAVDKAGINFDELSNEYWEKGSLSEAQYDKLDKAGIPKALVDQFIAGQEAILSATRSSVFNSVGGEDRYNEMTSWAADNLSEAEINTYNKAVNSGDMNAAMMAVKGLQARFSADAGFEPTRQVRGERATASSSVYRSIAELEKDMGDKRYWNDPAFRKDVERKLARSNIM